MTRHGSRICPLYGCGVPIQRTLHGTLVDGLLQHLQLVHRLDTHHPSVALKVNSWLKSTQKATRLPRPRPAPRPG